MIKSADTKSYGMVLYYAPLWSDPPGPPPKAVFIQADTASEARSMLEDADVLDAYDVESAELERLNVDLTYRRLERRVARSSLPTVAITRGGDIISN